MMSRGNIVKNIAPHISPISACTGSVWNITSSNWTGITVQRNSSFYLFVVGGFLQAGKTKLPCIELKNPHCKSVTVTDAIYLQQVCCFQFFSPVAGRGIFEDLANLLLSSIITRPLLPEMCKKYVATFVFEILCTVSAMRQFRNLVSC